MDPHVYHSTSILSTLVRDKSDVDREEAILSIYRSQDTKAPTQIINPPKYQKSFPNTEHHIHKLLAF
jgi:hypothetical protein